MESNPQSKHEFHIICLDDDQAFLNSLKMSLANKLTSGDRYHYNLLFLVNPIKTLKLINELANDKEEIAPGDNRPNDARAEEAYAALEKEI